MDGQFLLAKSPTVFYGISTVLQFWQNAAVVFIRNLQCLEKTSLIP